MSKATAGITRAPLRNIGDNPFGGQFLTVKPMVLFALKSLVAVALHDAVKMAMTDASPVEIVDFSPLSVFDSLRIDPKGPTIGYRSSLPLSWNHSPSKPVHGIDQVLQHLNQFQPPKPGPGAEVTHSIWQQIRINGLPSGQWRLGLQWEGSIRWLQYWNTMSPQTLPVDRSSNLAPSAALLSPAQLAQRLQLHPLVVIQYVYGRCFQISQSGDEPERASGVSLPLQAKADAASPVAAHSHAAHSHAAGGNKEQAVLLALIHLVDHLADPHTAPRRLFRLGYQLAESTDLWLGNLPALNRVNGEHRLLLLGIQRALKILLTVKFKYPLPNAL